ncbi:metalloprotease [Halobacteriales archaeon QH_7_69_31]|nr:MAG: metalloprotease [Halobacteriales archaeon QH_7_69_31]
MRPLWWILAGITLYTAVAMALSARGLLPASLRVAGPLLTVHTERGKVLLDRLAAPRRFWRAWGNFGVGLAVVIMVGSFFGVLLSAVSALSDPGAVGGITRPQDALVIPGVNRFLPWAAAVDILFGLLVGLVVHEGGHGLLCRVEDIEIESMGVALLAFVPLGAFVQPDEPSRERADRGGKTRMFAAGVTNNFLVTLVAFGLLFVVVGGLVTVVAGVPVGGALPGSPAEEAGVERGDVITSVNGQPVANESAFEAALASADREVTVGRAEGDDVTVERRLIVTRAVVDAPLDTGTAVRTVDGEAVHTESGFEAAVDGREVVELGTDEGTVRFPVGVFVSSVPGDGPLARSGAPDTPMLVASVDGEPTPTPEALAAVLANRSANDTVEVVAYHGTGTDPWRGDRHVYEVTLEANPRTEGGFLGVAGLQEGTSGVLVDDFGIDTYPADQYHAFLGGSGFGEDPISTFVFRMVILLTMPFANVALPGLDYNFAGFNGFVTDFYAVSGPLGAGAVFGLANVLFWTGWVNVNLGLFNCIPSYPLDGGHILRSAVEALLARLPGDPSPAVATALTGAISASMILSLLGLLFLPQLLS